MYLVTLRNISDPNSYQREYEDLDSLTQAMIKRACGITDTVICENNGIYINSDRTISIGGYRQVQTPLPQLAILDKDDDNYLIMQKLSMAINMDTGKLLKCRNTNCNFYFKLNPIMLENHKEKYGYYFIRCGENIDYVKFNQAAIVFELFDNKIIYIIKDRHNLFASHRVEAV